jgi:hypothetical protein
MMSAAFMQMILSHKHGESNLLLHWNVSGHELQVGGGTDVTLPRAFMARLER